MKVFSTLQKNRFSNTQGGQAMLIAVLFLLSLSLTIIFGFATPIIKQFKIESNLSSSRESYFLAEAGVEDVVYRLRNSMSVSPIENLTLGDSSVETVTTDESGKKVVIADANTKDLRRKVETEVITGVGASFNYGVQTGNGGFIISNNATVDGNVYSNGNITGANGAVITGSAIAANSIALLADQTNETPSTPPSSITFATSSVRQDFAQSFQVSTTTTLNKVEFYIKKVGSPSNATVRIVTDSGGSPSTNNLTTGTLSASLVTTSYGWVTVTLSSNPQLNTSTTYWVVIDGSDSTSKYYIIGANSTYSSGQGKLGVYGGTWKETIPAGLDGYFKIYLGGLTATINQISVGTESGDAWAHTVTNSNVTGTIYCQTGSGNNKTCDTSRLDPVPQAFPISDANILAWKEEASAGGVHSGNYSTSSASVSLGPKEITGNLNITNGATLTLYGTLWIHGDVIFDNNVDIQLASAYGSDSGVIVTDGKVLLSNNATFQGSGASGSYVMVITTSDCPTSSSCGGAYAIDVGNNVGAVILNAQSGTIYFSNNSGAKTATARTISINNNTTITYETGLADINFSSGPGGTWNIISWKEVE